MLLIEELERGGGRGTGLKSVCEFMEAGRNGPKIIIDNFFVTFLQNVLGVGPRRCCRT